MFRLGSAMGADAADYAGLSHRRDHSGRPSRASPRKSPASKARRYTGRAHITKGTYENESSTDYRNIDLGALAMLALEGAAEALRKSQPELSKEQAFAKVYCDPANRVAMKAERRSARARMIGGFRAARTEPDF